MEGKAKPSQPCRSRGEPAPSQTAHDQTATDGMAQGIRQTVSPGVFAENLPVQNVADPGQGNVIAADGVREDVSHVRNRQPADGAIFDEIAAIIPVGELLVPDRDEWAGRN